MATLRLCAEVVAFATLVVRLLCRTTAISSTLGAFRVVSLVFSQWAPGKRVWKLLSPTQSGLTAICAIPVTRLLSTDTSVFAATTLETCDVAGYPKAGARAAARCSRDP